MRPDFGERFEIGVATEDRESGRARHGFEVAALGQSGREEVSPTRDASRACGGLDQPSEGILRQ